jgi:hypothetical protein
MSTPTKPFALSIWNPLPEALAARDDAVEETVLHEPDGLSVRLFRLPPGATAVLTDPASGGGQSLLVLQGAILHAGRRHGRLSALFALLVLASLVLAHQSYRLTVVQGKAHLELAEDRLVSERWTPTLRGRILDRKGRVLAHDEPSFDILADYPVISGEWARTRAARQARRENRAIWGSLKPQEREQLILQAKVGLANVA